MSKFALLAASLLILGTTAVACAPGSPDEPGDESAGESEAGASLSCGGFAGIQCPAGKVCVDDPTDSCDPDNGGADCGGVCRGGKPVKNSCKSPNRTYVGTSTEQCSLIRFVCAEGTEYFADACGCGCESSPGGTPCGTSKCGAGQFCCNESCGICAPAGGYCTQQYCGTI